jgi:hypothetical protein
MRRKGKKRWTWLGAIAIAALATYLAPDTAVSSVWTVIGRAVAWTLKTLSGPVTLPMWVVGLGAAIVLALVAVCVTVVIVSATAKTGPNYTDFTNAMVLGIKWTWRWSGNRIDEDSLGPLCPRCDYDLRRIASTYNWEDASLKCDHCGEEWHFQFKMPRLLDRVLREIHRRLRKGEWPGAQQDSG